MLFSVILPVHQGAAYLEQALQSLADHTPTPAELEILAVDDGSTDASPAILSRWQTRLPLRVIRREGGSNWMAATNAGLREACGEWISFLHQDDRWEPQRLAELQAAIDREPAVRFFCHPVWMLDPRGRRIGRWSPAWPVDRAIPGRELLPRLAAQNPLAIPSPCFHRDLRRAVGELREDLWFLADWDYWLRLLHQADAARCLPQILAGFRLHPDSQTATRSQSETDLRWQFAEIRKQVENLSGGVHPRAAESRLNEDLTLTLANWSHRQPGHPGHVLRGLLRLGPRRSLRFLKETRLHQRLLPRLKLHFRH